MDQYQLVELLETVTDAKHKATKGKEAFTMNVMAVAELHLKELLNVAKSESDRPVGD